MSSPASDETDVNNWFNQVHYQVHIRIVRYMLSSFQDHLGLETSKHRSPRLCLVDYEDEDDDLNSEFRLLFCDCIHRQDSENGYQWQWRCVDIRITPRIASRFLHLEPGIADTNDALLSFSRLPNQADNKLSRQFVLRELRTQLANAKQFGIPKPHTGTRTLRHFLAECTGDSNNDLGDVEHKLTLSCVLTKGLRRFYKTSMMPRPWTEDIIEFMFRKYDDGSTGVIHHFPMISAPADPDPPEDDISVLTSRFDAQSLEDPKFPEIKALGVLLLQIWLTMPMAQLSRQYPGFFENGTVTRMGQLNLCHSLDTGILGHLPAELRPVCRIIERCFDDEAFEEQYIRYQIYERLLEPLERLYRA